jgi:chromate reductase, NAD(P)H dehydrogenase (quinone)
LGWPGPVPPFNEDLEGGPAPVAVAELRRVITDADGVLIATPEYNGSIPGQLKNALDWASRPRGAAVLEGKPVATLSASPSRRGGQGAQADLRKVLGVIGAEIRGEEIAVPHIHEQFDEHGGLVDRELRGHLRSTMAALAGPAAAASAPEQLPIPASRPQALQALAAWHLGRAGKCWKEKLSMYAVLRLNSFDPATLAVSADRLKEFDRIHAAQPGYLGSVVVDLGAGRRFALNLWESEQHSAAAFEVLAPEVTRLLGPLMAGPSQLIGAGPVISSDLVPSAGA